MKAIHYTNEKFKEIKASEVLEFSENKGLEWGVINICPEVEYQMVLGFGGAFTESAAYCYSLLKAENKKKLLDLYFSKEGLGYNFCRTHINSCDFSLDRYVYVEDNDTELKTFCIDRDKKYIIPFIKDAQKICGKDLMIFASPWSAPAWMKTNDSVVRGGKIKPEYLPVWAEYYCKYIKAFAKEGIEISAISVQNEPKAVQSWESCEFTAKDEGVFVRDYLAPALEKNGLADVKIIIWDHNKERVYDRARDTFKVEGARDLIWGIGFHWYSGLHFDAVGAAHKMFPEKVLIETEYCKSMNGKYENFGTDRNPLSYAIEMTGNFNNGMSASVDWNMLLDFDGGPYHDRKGGCKAPIMVDTDKGEFSLTEIFYNIYQFSHFIKRGAIRIGSSSYNENILVAAFKNPDGKIVAVLTNKSEKEECANLRINDQILKATLPATSVSTFVIE